MGLYESLSAEARQHSDDSHWISQNADALFNSLSDITSQSTPEATRVEDLLILFPYVTAVDDMRRWTKLLNDTAHNLYTDIAKTPEASLTYTFLVAPQSDEVRINIDQSVRRARKRLLPRTVTRAYLALFNLHVYRGVTKVTPQLVQSAIHAIGQANLPRAQGDLYLSLAFAYFQWQAYATSRKQAELAYNHWQLVNSPYEMALAAYVMARAYRRLDETAASQHWFEQTIRLFEKSNSPMHLALVLYEMGTAAYYLDQFDKAQHLFESAISASRKQDDHTITETLRQALGTTLIQLKAYDDADDALTSVLQYWQTINNPFRVGQTLYTLKYLASARGDSSAASNYNQQLQVILESTSTEPDQTRQLDSLRDIINKQGAGLLSLS